MATFEAQVEGLTSLSIDGSSAPTQTELTQFLTDGGKEILSVIPKQKKAMYSTSNTLNASSTTLTIGGSEILGVVRNDGTIDQPCRRIPLNLSGRAQDSEEMVYGTATDPVWWITSNALNMFPTPTNAQTATVQTLAYPAVAYGDSAITKFPDEAEYLVPIYASIKAIQNALGAKSGNTAISTALTYMKAALDQAEEAADKFESATESIFGDEETFLTSNSQLTRVKDALDKVSDIINGNQPSATTDAFGAQSSEDIELAKSALSIASVEINRAQAHLSEWVSIGDMRVKEINSALSEARGYAEEIQARLSVLTTEYTWLEKQQAKLQVDYDKGLQMIAGA
jgi:hypothetical protein|tara:strand:+ start:6940 stop:7962 length:1023 start_codon:yes stop_codon:yes gene_type:complete